MLEIELDAIFKWLREKQNIPISWRELKGDTLEQAKKFCNLVGLNLARDNKIWQEIYYYSIRNCIIHNNGSTEGRKDEKLLISYAKHKVIISEFDDKKFDLTKQYCEEIIAVIEDFISKVWDEVYKLRPKIAGVTPRG